MLFRKSNLTKAHGIAVGLGLRGGHFYSDNGFV